LCFYNKDDEDDGDDDDDDYNNDDDDDDNIIFYKLSYIVYRKKTLFLSYYDIFYRLDILLKQKDANISSLAIEIVRHVENCLVKKQNSQNVISSSSYQQNNLKQSLQPTLSSLSLSQSSSSLSSAPFQSTSFQSSTLQSSSTTLTINKQELHEYILKSVKDIIGIDNPVLKLFTKRIYKLILRGILGQNYQHLLPSYSLQSPAHQSNIQELISKSIILFNHNYSIHFDLYNDIIARACTFGLNSNDDIDNKNVNNK